MSNSKQSQEEISSSISKKRNLPSWMTSKDDDTTKSSVQKKPEHKENNAPSEETSVGTKSKARDPNLTDFSKLLDGVVFVLSGFVNPERGTLRSRALEMGAEFRQDWSPECTLLVCAYSNTPKFRQVEADNGTIIKKDWILECYSQRKLVEIDSYLMHAGKPWRENYNTTEISSDQKPSTSIKSGKQVERGSHSKSTAPSSSKTRASNPDKEQFPPSKVKEWAIDDLNRTLTWLESQEEKPEPSEIKEIASGGIIICLQDAIDSFEQDQDIKKIVEQWNIVPRAIEELIKLVDNKTGGASLSREDLCRQAKSFKQIYEEELNSITINDDSKLKTKRQKNGENKKGGSRKSVAVDYDSDETIEMTEEEIGLAYNNVAS
ncbi:DNA-repair protein XRCC1 isoform X2 [Mercurialis annua]|uniref:DNA-repair protein XRCC1 isoform X2 n=1 Tax=Mercurialis annua TaxID=3986 RepID=UPI0021607176|nr:DNA-repair protein XRCC1 isoform X2 [Mercurialis annua]